MSKSYDCARRNGIEIKNISRHIGTYNIGERVSWTMNGLPSKGWLRSCVSHSTLHGTGLTFHDDASLSGNITPLAEEEIWFTAYHTGQDSKIIRLNLHLYVHTHRPASEGSFKGVDSGISSSADAAIAHYTAWERRRKSHSDTVNGMNEEFARMKAMLDKKPTSGKGFGWGILGALHMNTHKLLENVLLEAEQYLGLALTFGGKAAEFAESNLEGCYAKRQLEAAKFIWIKGLEKTLQLMSNKIEGQDAEKELIDCEDTFERAAGKKSGWGWGVNNGEIFLSAASVKFLRSLLASSGTNRLILHKSGCDLVKRAEERNKHFPWMMYLKEFCENSAVENSNDQRAKYDDFVQQTSKWMQASLRNAQPRPRAKELPRVPWVQSPVLELA